MPSPTPCSVNPEPRRSAIYAAVAPDATCAAHHSDVTVCSGSPKKAGDSGHDGRGEHPVAVTETPGRTAWPIIMQTWAGWPTTMQIARPSPRKRTSAPDEFPEVNGRASCARAANWMQRSGHLSCKVTSAVIGHGIWPLSIASGQRGATETETAPWRNLPDLPAVSLRLEVTCVPGSWRSGR